MPPEADAPAAREATRITRREAILRVSALFGGVALVGGPALLSGCRSEGRSEGRGDAGTLFSTADVAFLDEVAETILPQTQTPGAKAAQVGAFMALMVTDAYDAREQEAFRDGMRQLDEASRARHGASFMEATPAQRLALLEQLDREQMAFMQERDARKARAPRRPSATGSTADTSRTADSTQGDAYLSDQRQENAPGNDAGSGAAAITEEPLPHYFRMMKELALLGYFTSEIGYTQAMRYAETPGRYDPCLPYTPGEKAWAPHA